MKPVLVATAYSILMANSVVSVCAETLTQQLKAESAERLAEAARAEGNAARGSDCVHAEEPHVHCLPCAERREADWTLISMS